MIALVVVAILAMIAVPAYQDSIRKSRRSEAFTALAAVQQSQERWRGNNSNYSTSLTDLRVSGTTPSGYYGITVAAPSADANALATGYVATATAVTGTTQAADSACAKLSVRLLNGNLSYAGCGACDTFTYTETNACWAR